jgi:hypothetical protein
VVGGGASPQSSVVLCGLAPVGDGLWVLGEVSGTFYGGGRGWMDGRVQGSENGLRVEQGAKEDAGRGSRKSTVTRMMDQRQRVEPSERQSRATIIAKVQDCTVQYKNRIPNPQCQWCGSQKRCFSACSQPARRRRGQSRWQHYHYSGQR